MKVIKEAWKCAQFLLVFLAALGLLAGIVVKKIILSVFFSCFGFLGAIFGVCVSASIEKTEKRLAKKARMKVVTERG